MTYNPVFITCDSINHLSRSYNAFNQALRAHTSHATHVIDALAQRSPADLVTENDVIVRSSGSGLSFSASKRLRSRLRKKLKLLKRSATLNDVMFGSGISNELTSVTEPEAVYSTEESYSRLGE